MYKYFPASVTNTERPNNHDEIYGFLQMCLGFAPHKGILGGEKTPEKDKTVYYA